MNGAGEMEILKSAAQMLPRSIYWDATEVCILEEEANGRRPSGPPKSEDPRGDIGRLVRSRLIFLNGIYQAK